MTQLIRPGIDQDPVKPWNYATTPLGAIVEILSYPCEDKIMIRTTPGDPTTLTEVPLNQIAAFSPSRLWGQS